MKVAEHIPQHGHDAPQKSPACLLLSQIRCRTKRRILIIGSTEEAGQQLRLELEKLGYFVIGIAPSIDSALSETQYEDPDVVLIDSQGGIPPGGTRGAARAITHTHAPSVLIADRQEGDLQRLLALLRPHACLLAPWTQTDIEVAVELALMRFSAEQEGATERSFLSTAVSSTTDAVITFSPQEVVTWLNRSAEQLTGWSAAEAIGRPLSKIWRLEGDSVLVSKKGTRTPIRLTQSSVLGPAGQTIGSVLVCHPTASEEASDGETGLKNREYRTLMEEAAEAITIADAQGKYVAVNSRACELLGYTRDEFLQKNIRDLIPADQLDTNPIRFDDLRAGLTIVRERQLKRKDGAIIDVEVSAKALSNGTLQGIIRDISERKAAERELALAVRNEVPDRLLAKLQAFAHGESPSSTLSRLTLFADNIDRVVLPKNNPVSLQKQFINTCQEFLTSVAPRLSQIETLLTLLCSDASWASATNNLAGLPQSIAHNTRILQSSLTTLLSHVRTGVPLFGEPQVSELAAMTRAAIHSLRDTISTIATTARSRFTCDINAVVQLIAQKFSVSHGPTIECDIPDSPLFAVTGQPEITEALSIVVQNAVESFGRDTPLERPPRVSLEIRTVGSRVQITVTDNGPGIHAPDHGELFTLGYSTKGVSRGFGLSHARNCIIKFGGTLHTDASHSPGSRFVIDLPRA